MNLTVNTNYNSQNFGMKHPWINSFPTRYNSQYLPGYDSRVITPIKDTVKAAKNKAQKLQKTVMSVAASTAITASIAGGLNTNSDSRSKKKNGHYSDRYSCDSTNQGKSVQKGNSNNSVKRNAPQNKNYSRVKEQNLGYNTQTQPPIQNVTVKQPAEKTQSTNIETNKTLRETTESIGKSITIEDYVKHINSRLKTEIPEFEKQANERILNSWRGPEYVKEHVFDFTEYTDKLINIILENDSLKENQSIRNNIFNLVGACLYLTYENNPEYVSWRYKEQDEITNSRLKVLKEYASNKDMQQNPHISSIIGSLVDGTDSDEKAELCIDILNNFKDSKQIEVLNDGLYRLVHPKALAKILKNEQMYKTIDFNRIWGILRSESFNQKIDGYLKEEHHLNFTDYIISTQRIPIGKKYF